MKGFSSTKNNRINKPTDHLSSSVEITRFSKMESNPKLIRQYSAERYIGAVETSKS